MAIPNQIMLITYGDSMGKNIRELEDVLNEYFTGAVGGVHILPFFPSSADRGFAPIRYDQVDPALGKFSDIQRLSKRYYLMFDFMINHISRSSPYFQDFQGNKDQSPYYDFFIHYKDFWENGAPTKEQVDQIYKRRPRTPSIDVHFADGTMETVWCTFSEEQIDLNVEKPAVKEFIRRTLEHMCQMGASVIRLDAFAYAVKKPDTSCFFVEPEIWTLLKETKQIVQPLGVEILPEIHEHYSMQIKLAGQGYWVYDFALPMLVLHALYTGKGERLKHWLDICPRKQFTTLDTHDGIGVVDAADLLRPEEMEETKELLFTKGANVKRIYNTEAYNNLDVYQINCTYYSALGNNDQAYLLARAIQLFAPGIPQVYYVGALAGRNDIALMEATKQGRDINRHSYSKEEVAREVQRPVVQDLLRLMRFRNACPAFGGTCQTALEGTRLIVTREAGDWMAELSADLSDHQFTVTQRHNGKETVVY